jgi:hypothetical protein
LQNCCSYVLCVVCGDARGRLINMAPWDAVQRAQRKTTGREIAKANKDTDDGFKKAAQAVLKAFNGSTCDCHSLTQASLTLSLTRNGAAAYVVSFCCASGW